MLTVGSLFTGIGGLDLGLERAGMTVRWQSEISPYACRVLAKHWPDVPNLGDVTTIDWTTVENVDVVCGGYPCQPFSLAGARAGDADARHLWPFFADALRHLRPRWALLENVPGHLSLGFGRVLGDLAELGFDAEWDCIPAAAVGAPHLRYRVFVVAHTDSDELREQPVRIGRGNRATLVADDGTTRDVADVGGRLDIGGGATPDPVGDGRSVGWARWATASSAQRSTYWAVEPDVGRVADGVPARMDRLRCLGNAVVPQVAEYVGRRIVTASEAI